LRETSRAKLAKSAKRSDLTRRRRWRREALDVDESQVSRDERNEYHGMTVDRAARVLDALKAEVRTTVELSA
jgi:hypothetical protein